ncbi:MAG: DMT family transporter [Candidatus Tectimicrobiota bacterium]
MTYPRVATVESPRLDLASVLTMTGLCTLWGGSFISIKFSLRGIPPVGLVGLRFALVALCLWAYLRWQGLGLWFGRESFRWLAASGLLMSIQMSILFVAMQFTTAGRASILLNLQPFFVLLMAHFFLDRDPLTIRKVLGMTVAFAGVVVLFADRWTAVERLGLMGDSLIVLSAFGWSLQIVLLKRPLAHLPPAGVVAWQSLFVAVIGGLAALLIEGRSGYNITPVVVVAFLYLSLVAAAFCFVVYVHLVQRTLATQLHSFAFLTPVFSVLGGAILLGEAVGWPLLVGLVGVATGIVVVNSGPAAAPLPEGGG